MKKMYICKSYYHDRALLSCLEMSVARLPEAVYMGGVKALPHGESFPAHGPEVPGRRG